MIQPDKLRRKQQKLILKKFLASLFVNEEKIISSKPYIPNLTRITLYLKGTQLQLQGALLRFPVILINNITKSKMNASIF